jgi:hypothetical protein
MSVEYAVVRVPGEEFDAIRSDGRRLPALVDDWYASPDAIDSRATYRDGLPRDVAAPRLLHSDEFTTSLLVSFLEGEETPLFDALVGWGRSQQLEGVAYGAGAVAYYTPSDAAVVSEQLDRFPDAELDRRLHDRVDQFRLAAASVFADDDAILAHQRAFAHVLRQLYRAAVSADEFVLLMIV